MAVLVVLTIALGLRLDRRVVRAALSAVLSSGKSALKEPLGAKPAPGKASAGQPSAGTIVGGVEFEVERPKGDAGEMIDPEQLNLF